MNCISLNFGQTNKKTRQQRKNAKPNNEVTLHCDQNPGSWYILTSTTKGLALLENNEQ